MSEACTCVSFGIMSTLLVPVLMRMTYIDRSMNSVHPTERRVVPYRSQPVPILMIYEAPCEAESSKSDIHQGATEDLEMLVMLKNIVSKDISTDVRAKNEENIKLSQKSVKLHRDHHVRSVPIFREGDKIYLDTASLFRSAVENAADEGYIQFFPRKEKL